MLLQFSKRAQTQYESLEPGLRKIAQKQFTLLVGNLRHPSLRAKKYDESTDVWQARINKSWRFYFTIIGDVYFIATIRQHPK